MSELRTSSLGTTFLALNPEVAAWMIPAIEVVTAISSVDADTVSATLERVPVDADTVAGLAILAARLLAELGDEGEVWVRELALEAAQRSSL